MLGRDHPSRVGGGLQGRDYKLEMDRKESLGAINSQLGTIWYLVTLLENSRYLP